MRKSTLAIIAGALALGLAPDPLIQPAAWAAENLIVADGPHAGHRWSPDLTPYAVEILNNLAVESPHNRVSVRKSAQTGLTEVGIAWIGSIIDKTPARAMVIFPTVSAVQDFNREKLSPTIEATEALRKKIRQHRSRSAQSSTALNKRFPGGSLTLTGANSAADLRSKTVQFVFGDEVDEWPLDLDGQGDPMEMAKARQTAFHATGNYMLFEASTPTIKGMSRIDVAFEEGDRRYWKVPCPHCDEYQRLVFGSKEHAHGLKFSTEWPYQAHYVCEHCGGVIEHRHKRAMVMAGKWIAEAPGPGRHPSYHIDALVSLLTTWDKLVEAFLKAKDDPTKLKAFTNLWLGEAWEERGDAPDWQRLLVRREAYPARRIPDGGVIVTAGVDVQAAGLYYEVVAWGFDRQSWSIDAGYLEGDTADASNPVWAKLDRIYDRPYQNATGNTLRIDMMAIDSGFNSNAVYAWTRRHPRAMAIKGQDGWHRAAISSAPSQVDVTVGGRKVKRGAALWHVGTWSLKAQLYANLRKDGVREGATEDPAGFVHLSESVNDEAFVKQLTAEKLSRREVKGRQVAEWQAVGPNHFHDCRIYAMAVAEHMGVGIMSAAAWDSWAVPRNTPPAAQGDLLAAAAAPAAEISTGATEPAETEVSDEPVQAAADEAPEKHRKVKPPRRPRGGGFVGRWRA